jgi:hypothetical protein
VHGAALARQNLVVDRLLDERVPERVAAPARVVVGHEEVPLDRRSQPQVQLVAIHAGDRGEDLLVDATPGHRRDAKDVLGALRGGRDPGGQRRANGRRQCPDGDPAAAGHQQLLDEEGIAVRPALDPVDELRGRVGAVDRGDEAGGLLAAEPFEVDPLEPTRPGDLGEPGQERVAAVDLVGPVGQAQRDTVGGEVRNEERDRVTGRRVGPVEVLDHEQERPIAGDPLEHPEQGLEHVGLGGGLGVRAGGRDRCGRSARRGKRGQARQRGDVHISQRLADGVAELADRVAQ